MNEITLLRDYGPDAAPAEASALSAARSELLAAMTATPAKSTRRGRTQTRTRTGWRPLATRAAVLMVAAACVTGVVIAANPANHTSTGTTSAVTLVAYQTPVFPLSLAPLPAGLTPPSFSGGPDNLLAVYPAVTGSDDDVDVIVSDRDLSAGITEASGLALRSITLDGHTAKLYGKPTVSGVNNLNLSWERKPGQWVSVAGNGRFATEAGVRGLAAALVDRPQQIPLQIHLAPDGWTLRSFKDNTILTLRQPGADDTAATLSVQLLTALDVNFAHDIGGATTPDAVRVNGRPGELAQARGEWILQAELPGGHAFRLQAPSQLTRQQVLLIANSVTAS